MTSNRNNINNNDNNDDESGLSGSRLDSNNALAQDFGFQEGGLKNEADFNFDLGSLEQSPLLTAMLPEDSGGTPADLSQLYNSTFPVSLLTISSMSDTLTMSFFSGLIKLPPRPTTLRDCAQ